MIQGKSDHAQESRKTQLSPPPRLQFKGKRQKLTGRCVVTEARVRREALTHIELIWHRQETEHWIRFGRDVAQQILDRRRRILSFAPNSIVAYVRWAAGDFGTIVSRIDILRTVRRGEGFSTVPYVRPGGEILLRASGWPRVERVLQAIDAAEQIGIDAADACPDHWRHVHNRLAAGQAPRPYSPAAHRAWLLRHRIEA